MDLLMDLLILMDLLMDLLILMDLLMDLLILMDLPHVKQETIDIVHSAVWHPCVAPCLTATLCLIFVLLIVAQRSSPVLDFLEPETKENYVGDVLVLCWC